MEKNYYDEGFESFLREKTDEYKLYPSDKVWGQIQRKLHPRSKWPFLAAALLLLGIGVGTRYALEDLNHVTANGQGQTEKSFPDGTRPPGTSTDPSTDIGSAPSFSPGASRGSAASSNAPSARGAGRMTVASLNPSASVYPGTANPGLTVVPPSPGVEMAVAQTELQDKEIVSSMTVPQHGISPMNAGRLAGQFPLATLENKPSVVAVNQEKAHAPSALDAIIAGVSKVSRKARWQLYFAPSVSYRKLEGQASKYVFPYNSFAYSTSYGFARDVNDAVRHRPALGMEFGTALLYPLSRNLRVKAGLQLNYNAYQVEAYSYVPEIAPFGSNGPGSFANSVNTMSYYRNFNGFDKTTLKNAHMMISVPLGIEVSVIGNSRVKFNLASTIQPTYVINNQAYLISTNLKNYAQEPSLYRKWNVNAGAEAFLSVNTGTYSWVFGPQVRYQLLSSYKEKYPIKEHLMDFGFKIGVNKTFR